MATLNLSKIKHMSEANLKKFASLIISLSSQVTDVENKCIKPYVGGELYPRDSYVSHDGYIYQATATNQDSAFDETHWDKLSDDFNELTVADIEGMLGLSSEQLETMANLIADTEVRLDKTYSSSKIYQDIQQCLNDSKSYTLKEIAKLNGASYKVVASTSEMTSESIIYLLTSGNTYDMYIVEEDGATTKIGNMDVDLSQYVKVTDLEADYLKKADADGKFATIDTVDGKVDKDKIVTVLDDTVTDEQILNALALKELLDEKNGTALTKGDIGDSINSKSTTDEIVSAKLAYTNLIRGNSVTQSYLDEMGTNDVLQFPEGKYIIHEGATYANLPEDVRAGYLEIWNMNGGSHETPFNSAWKYRVVKLQDFDSKKSYYRVLRSGNSGVFLDTGWQRVCITKVADVADTIVSTNDVFASTDDIRYCVSNGVCTLNFEANSLSYTTDVNHSWAKATDDILPRAKMGVKFPLVCMPSGKSIICTMDINNENLKVYGIIPSGTTGIYGSCSYPVKE